MNKDVDLTADGSLRTGNTLVNNAGVAIVNGTDSTTTTATGTTVTNGLGDKTTMVAGGTTMENAIGDKTVAMAGGTVMENVALDKLTTTASGTVMENATGGKTIATADGTVISDAAGANTTIGAGKLSMTDANGTTSISGNQVAVGGLNPITINGNAGTIGGLTNTTFDPDATYTGGVAATQEQLSQAHGELVTQGLDFVGDDGNTVHRDLGETLSVKGGAAGTLSEGNIGIVQDGVGGLKIQLARNIDLGPDGSVKTGNSLLNNAGLAVDDGAGNSTVTTTAGTVVTNAAGDSTTTTASGSVVANAAGDTATMSATGTSVTNAAGDTTTTTAAGTSITNAAGDTTITSAAGTVVTSAAGDTTQVGAGTIGVTDANGTTNISGNQVAVGGLNPITISGDTGMIEGLANRDLSAADFGTVGRAATEEQLALVNETASAGWNVSANGEDSANVVPGGSVDFSNTDGNIEIARVGTNLEFNLADNLQLAEDGSLAIGDAANGSQLDKGGLTVTDGGNQASVGAGTIAVTDSNGTTAIGGNQIVVGGLSPIVISGNTGTIEGLTNTTVNYVGFGTAGRAATEEQIKPMTDFIGLGNDGSFNYNGGKFASLQDALDSMSWNVEAPAADTSGESSGGTGTGAGGTGSGSTGSGGKVDTKPTPIHNGNTVGFVEGDNIVISKTDRAGGKGTDVKVSVSKDIKVDSVTAKTINAGKVNAQEIAIENGPTINQSGIDMGGKRIVNVGAATAPTDAVNLGQLEAVGSNLQGQINSVRGDMNRLNNKLSAGVAAAMATAGLPQAYLPGKSMMAIAGGTYNGESGFAIGLSTVSDNGSWVLKLSGNSNSRGDYGGAVGVGYQW